MEEVYRPSRMRGEWSQSWIREAFEGVRAIQSLGTLSTPKLLLLNKNLLVDALSLTWC